MAFTYLPKNVFDGSITLENITKEFVKPVEATITSSTYVESVASSFFDTDMSGSADMRGCCWGGSNNQYFYVADNNTNTIYRYVASNPYQMDIDDVGQADMSLNVGTGSGFSKLENSPQGVVFNTNGTRMFVAGDGAGINEYKLSTPWDITTASYSANISMAQRKIKEYAPIDLTFSSDGKKLFVMGDYKNAVHTIKLRNAFSLSRYRYAGAWILVDTIGIPLMDRPTSIAFNKNGSEMFVSGYQTGQTSFIYKFKLSTAFEPTTAKIESALIPYVYETVPQSLTFAPFGKDGAGNDLNENLTMIGPSGLHRWELPVSGIPTPYHLGDYYRGEELVEDNDQNKLIPTKFDLSRVNYYNDSPAQDAALTYNSAGYITSGVYFDERGEFMYTNAGQGIDTLVFKHTLDSAFNLDTLSAAPVETMSIAAQKLQGFSQENIYNNWYRFQHQNVGNIADNDFFTNTRTYTSPAASAWAYDSDTASIACNINSGYYIGFVSSDTYHKYDIKMKMTSIDNADNDTISFVLGYFETEKENDPSTRAEHTLSFNRHTVNGIGDISGNSSWTLTLNLGQNNNQSDAAYKNLLAYDIDSNGDNDFFMDQTLLLSGTLPSEGPIGFQSWYGNQTWVHCIKEGSEYAIYFGEVETYDANDTNFAFPPDWRNSPSTQTSDTSWDQTRKFGWIYFNVLERPTVGTINIGTINKQYWNGSSGVTLSINYGGPYLSSYVYSIPPASTGTLYQNITADALENTFNELAGGVRIGPACWSQDGSKWENMLFNGIDVTNGDLYYDQFQNHKIGAGGRKLYTAINTVFIESAGADSNVVASEILEYDLPVSNILGYNQFSEHRLSTYKPFDTLTRGTIKDINFGYDSFETAGSRLYVLSNPGSSSDSTVDGVITQYNVLDPWNIASALVQYETELNLGFNPNTFSFMNDGAVALFAGDDSDGTIKVGNLLSPYNINTLVFQNDSASIFKSGLREITGLYTEKTGKEIIASGIDSAGNSAIFKFVNENPTSQPIPMSAFNSGLVEYVGVNGYNEITVPDGCNYLSLAAIGAGGYGAPGSMFLPGLHSSTDLPDVELAKSNYVAAYNAQANGVYGGGGAGLAWANFIPVQPGDKIGFHAGIAPIVKMIDSEFSGADLAWPRFEILGNQFDPATGLSADSCFGIQHPPMVWNGDSNFILSGNSSAAQLSPSNSWVSVNGEIVAIAGGGGGVKKSSSYPTVSDATIAGGEIAFGNIDGVSLENKFNLQKFGSYGGLNGNPGSLSQPVIGNYNNQLLFTENHLAGFGGAAGGWDENGGGGGIADAFDSAVLPNMIGCLPNSLTQLGFNDWLDPLVDNPYGPLYLGVGPGPCAREGGGTNIYGQSTSGLTSLLPTTMLESEIRGSYPNTAMAATPVINATYRFDSAQYNFLVNDDSAGAQPSNTFGTYSATNNRLQNVEETGYTYTEWASITKNNQSADGTSQVSYFGNAALTTDGVTDIPSFKNFGGGGSGQFDGTAVDSSGNISFVGLNEKPETSSFYASGGAGIVRLVFGRANERAFPADNVEQIYEV